MKKIPTIFERDWDGDRSRVVDLINPDAQWVFDGEGKATIKLDGTCCMVRNGKLFKRREVKKGKTDPANFELADHDENTGKRVGWVPVGDGPEDKSHREAWTAQSDLSDGKYELLGPKVQGNPEGRSHHVLELHGDTEPVDAPPRSFQKLSSWLDGKDIEGLVWHHPDGRMAKIKLRDFGLKRNKQ